MLLDNVLLHRESDDGHHDVIDGLQGTERQGTGTGGSQRPLEQLPRQGRVRPDLPGKLASPHDASSRSYNCRTAG